MKVLTKELQKKLLKYLNSLWDDYEEGDIQEAINVVNENLEKKLGSIDFQVLSRMIDDEELGREIDSIKEEEKGNVFD